MTIKYQLNDRDWAEALVDGACFAMAHTNIMHLHDAASDLAEAIGMRETYVGEQIDRVIAGEIYDD